MRTWLWRVLRLVYINYVLVKHGLDEVLLDTHLFRPLRFVLYLLPWNWWPRAHIPRAVRIRRALEDLGPIFVKFGQILSTRRDLLPEDIATELERLQDRVPPVPGAAAVRVIETALGAPVTRLFERFDTEPLASASIAQVHGARLLDGREVVVKVVRPGIINVIRRDIALLALAAEIAERYWPDGRRLRPKAVVREFETTILDELDLLREAASASQLRRNFEDTNVLKVPEVHWELTRRAVMVMERVSGIAINDVEVLRARGVDLKRLAELGVEIFFSQVFRHNFFHADMHPGNIFVDARDPKNPRYVAVDFGIMGTLTSEDRRYLAENFLAFFNRDYRRVAELHVQSGWVPAETRVSDFEAAIRSVCEPIFDRPLKDISFGHLLVRLFQTARRFHMEVQPQLVLLQKTLLNIEGIGRDLYPDLDLWQTAKPFLEEWMHEQLGARALWRELRAQAPRWGETLPALPGLVHEVLTQARTGRLKLQLGGEEFTRLRTEIRQSSKRTSRAVAGGALLLTAVLMLDRSTANMLAGVPLVSWVMGGIGVWLLAGAVLGDDG